MKKNSFSLFTCTEAAKICNKAEYKEASMAEKLRLHIHLFLCRRCKKYSDRNKKLSSLFEKANLQVCSEKEKTAFKEQMKNFTSDTSKDKKDQ
jgi:hypothetical protein